MRPPLRFALSLAALCGCAPSNPSPDAPSADAADVAPPDAPALDAPALDAPALDAPAADAPIVPVACAVPPGAGPRIRAAQPHAGFTCTRYPFALAAPRDAIEARDGTLYVTEMSAGRVSRVTSTGVVPVATDLSGPIGLREAPDGSLYVAEEHAHRVSRIDPATGARTTVAEGLGNVTYLALGPDGAAYVSSFTEFAPTGTVRRIALAPSSPAAATTFAMGLDVPEGLAFEPAGTLLVASWNTPSRVFRLPATGGAVTATTPVAAASLTRAYGVAVHPRTNAVYVAETDASKDRVTRVRSDGTLEDVLTDVASPAGLFFTPSGDLLVVEHTNSDAHNETGYLVRLRAL